MNFSAIWFLLVNLAVLGCNSAKSLDKDNPTDESPDEDNPTDKTGLSWEICDLVDKDPVELETATVEGDLLELRVSYAGGCGDHTFRLCWDGEYQLSAPVQAGARLTHDGHGDECSSHIEEKLAFDLTPLRLDWQDSFSGDSGTIMMHIYASGSKLEWIAYSF